MTLVIQILIAISVAAFLIFTHRAGILYNAIFPLVLIYALIMIGWFFIHLFKGSLAIVQLKENYQALGGVYWLQLVITASFFITMAVYNISRLPIAELNPEFLAVIKWVMMICIAVITVISVIPSTHINYFLITVMACFNGFMFKEFFAYSKHDFDNAVSIQSPFKKQAIVVQGGNSILYNHHYHHKAQRFALDIVLPGVIIDEQGEFLSKLEDYKCFGEPMYAPISGEIVAMEKDLPDVAIGDTDRDNPVGNYVVIKKDNNTFIMLAHLKQNSIKLVLGQHVIEGQDKIGECGNSGNTTAPHLHLQVQNHKDFNKVTQTYPIYIKTPTGPMFFKSNQFINPTTYL